MENSHEDTFVGNFILENGIGDYNFELIDNANGRFKLNGSSLLVKYSSIWFKIIFDFYLDCNEIY
jgi:hypothetical protein